MGKLGIVCKVYHLGHKSAYAREKLILLSVPKHPNIVPLLEFVDNVSESHVGALIFPMYPLCLSDRIVDGGALDDNDIAGIARDLLNALKCLHEFGYVHCDVKPANIMLDASASAVLIDLASSVREGEEVIEYSSPYSLGLHGGQASRSLDFRCLAVALLQCATGRLPRDLEELVITITSNEFVDIYPSTASLALRSANTATPNDESYLFGEEQDGAPGPL
jgi:serine/threonine protein kinase